MQPYFLPYLGYFSLIKNVDEFILFDTPQFIRHGWIERNRILKQGDGWLYIRVPLHKHSRRTSIQDVHIDNSQPWKERILAQMATYKRVAPHYQEAVDLVKRAIDVETTSIVQLNRHALEVTCDYLGVSTPIHVLSEMNLVLDDVLQPDEWALEICRKLGGHIEYWNPVGGASFFDRQKYEDAGMGLAFQSINLEPYSQRRGSFEPGLSIIDVIMFNDVSTITRMLDSYDLLR